MGTAPDSLDPGFGYTTQAAEPDWLSYTGLDTYAHANGTAGGQVIPGLCTALPTISDGGKAYTCTLRKGLVFSNGKPVKASDFAYTVERAIKIPWGGSGQFITAQIAGATAFSKGKANTISGITTERLDRQDHDPSDRPLRRVRQRARVPVARPDSDGHADEEPAQQPAAGCRAVHDHEHRAEPVVLAWSRTRTGRR